MNTLISISHIEDVKHLSFSEVTYQRGKAKSSLFQVHNTETGEYDLLNVREFELMKAETLDPERKVRRIEAQNSFNRSNTNRTMRAFGPTLLAMAALGASISPRTASHFSRGRPR